MNRLAAAIKWLATTLEGYKITRLEHSLQTATRAFRDKADEEMVVAALLHDIGDELAPLNHTEYAESVLKPYVSEKTHRIKMNLPFGTVKLMSVLLECFPKILNCTTNNSLRLERKVNRL